MILEITVRPTEKGFEVTTEQQLLFIKLKRKKTLAHDHAAAMRIADARSKKLQTNGRNVPVRDLT